MSIEVVKEELLEDLKKKIDLKGLNDLKVKYLGKKGLITELNSEIKNIPNEEKKEYGMKVNALREEFNSFYEAKKNEFELEELNHRLESESIDVTLPATRVPSGSPSILEKLVEEVEDGPW